MTFSFDPQVADALAPMAAQMADATPPPVGDIDGRRTALNAMLAHFNSAQPTPADVTTTDHQVRTADGDTIVVRWYAKTASAEGSGPAMVYLHGGGMILGSVDIFDGPVARYVSRSGVPMLSVNYRRRWAQRHVRPLGAANCELDGPYHDCAGGPDGPSADCLRRSVGPERRGRPVPRGGERRGGGYPAAALR
jgi:hypothetical protein